MSDLGKKFIRIDEVAQNPMVISEIMLPYILEKYQGSRVGQNINPQTE